MDQHPTSEMYVDEAGQSAQNLQARGLRRATLRVRSMGWRLGGFAWPVELGAALWLRPSIRASV
jgi:hypothetical protein